ncbi:hypothetical protein L4D20_10515 [Vibrio kyushuensis]|uniref:hypothetical protein n=1 Tax=Vibrio kyushuensis TaxID=2910249 RepID=UPI003D0BC77B
MNSSTISCEGFDKEKTFEFTSKTGRVSKINGASVYISSLKDGKESLIELPSSLPLCEDHVVSVIYARDPEIDASGIVGVYSHDINDALFVSVDKFSGQFGSKIARRFLGFPTVIQSDLMIIALSFLGPFFIGFAFAGGGRMGIFIGFLAALFLGITSMTVFRHFMTRSQVKTAKTRFNSICTNSLSVVDVDGVTT